MVALRRAKTSPRFRIRITATCAVLLVVLPLVGFLQFAMTRIASSDPASPQHDKILSVGRTADEPETHFGNSTVHAKHSRLPAWFVEYVTWHREQRQALNEKNYKNHRFLILRCLETDRSCGGLSDRIKPLPLFVLLAAQSKRIFMIYWNKPCALEEFLLPPRDGGLDWRVPEWLVPEMTQKQPPRMMRLIQAERIIDAVNGSEFLLSAKLQDQHGGSVLYNERQGEKAYRRVYGPLFWTLFEPSPPVAAALDAEMSAANLHAGEYAAAHLRAFYGKNPFPDDQIKGLTVNAIQCASELRPGVPVFFTSDSKLAIDHADRYGKHMHRPIITIDRGKEALHLDKASSRDPADYYDVFLDVLHFANAKCISHAQGGFGRLGVLVSHDSACLMPYITQGRLVTCEWRNK